MKRNLALLFAGIFTLVVVIGLWWFVKAPKVGPIIDGPLPGIKFVYIPPGSFLMGSPTDELGRQKEERRHQVTLSKGFYLMTTELTQAQWQVLMGNNPSHFIKCGQDCPVEQVSWNDVQEFIQRLNQREGSNKYRLPTEAEWEYAARAGSKTAFANGGITEAFGCAPNDNLDAMGFYCRNSNYTTHQVGQKQPNSWGLYDMHGNVIEWCQDVYEPYPEIFSSSALSVVDPVGPTRGNYRVPRGGAYSSYPIDCRSAFRMGHDPRFRSRSIGFRLAAQF